MTDPPRASPIPSPGDLWAPPRDPSSGLAPGGSSGDPQATAGPSNAAVWLPAKRAPFTVGAASLPQPAPGEIVVAAEAVAVNPIDWILQTVGDIIFPWLRYPAVLGSDVSGRVVSVGDGVLRFKRGDRVLGHAVGSSRGRDSVREGAFQHYVVLCENMAAPIPDSLSFEAAAVLPLGVSTAAAALFEANLLALAPPTGTPEPRRETVLVWGASTSVGSNAVQLARAAGYEVIATASSHNFALAERLGARAVFDYRSTTAVADIIAALGGRRLAGAVAIGVGAARPCLEVVAASAGPRIVALATPPASFKEVPAGRGRLSRLVPVAAGMLLANVSLSLRARRRGARVTFFNAGDIRETRVSRWIYEDFLPLALAEGRYRAAPDPLVYGEGLDAVPGAVEAHRRGVSAKKIVVRLRQPGAS